MLIEDFRQVFRFHFSFSFEFLRLFFLVSFARKSFDERKIVELFYKKLFFQFHSRHFVSFVLHRSNSSFDRHQWKSVDIYRSKNNSRLWFRDLVHSFVYISRHCTKNGTKISDDPSNGQFVFPTKQKNFCFFLLQIVDLFFFTYIILIAMTAYAVASRTMFNFNSSSPILFDGRSIFRNLIYPTYYLMYGNIGGELTSLDGRKQNLTDSTKEKCRFFSISADLDSSVSIATHILLAFHMLFVNILLINLLIATFT